jgi:hypothetical protein
MCRHPQPEAVLRNPKVDVDHRDIYLRRGLRGMVSIFLHVMNTDAAGSTSYGIRQHGRRRVASFLHRHIRTSGRRPFAPADSTSTTNTALRRRVDEALQFYQAFPKESHNDS